MEYKKYLVVAGLLVVAFSAGRFFGPTKVEIVEKYAYATSEMMDRIRVINETEKETRLPDGTIIKERTTSKETQTKRQTETKEEREVSKTVESRPEYRLGALYEPSIKGLQESSYSVILEKRLFSEVYAGVSVSSHRTFGVTLSLGF